MNDTDFKFIWVGDRHSLNSFWNDKVIITGDCRNTICMEKLHKFYTSKALTKLHIRGQLSTVFSLILEYYFSGNNLSVLNSMEKAVVYKGDLCYYDEK